MVAKNCGLLRRLTHASDEHRFGPRTSLITTEPCVVESGHHIAFTLPEQKWVDYNRTNHSTVSHFQHNVVQLANGDQINATTVISLSS